MCTEIYDIEMAYASEDPETDACKRLWMAVLVTAISDAMQLGSPLRFRRHEARDAIRWIVHGGQDFVEVCSNAGVEHTKFKNAALEHIEAKLGGTLLRSVIAPHVSPWGR
jgi:hypothetical protein